MVFSSIIFLFCFLPIALIGYFLLPQRLRNIWLLGVSLVFYAWGEPRLIVVLLASMSINFFFGAVLDRLRDGRQRPFILWLGIAGNLGLLGYYKYSGFLVANYNVLADWFGLPSQQSISVALPLGISFYTFQGISYLVDIYRRDTKAARNPIHLMLYISLFPHQLAGPIVRFRDVAGQIASRQVTREAFRAGIMRFTVGLAKKVLLANILAGVADGIFAQPAAELTWDVAWLGVICYTLQIYLDFSAYSDMAIGMAGMFGITFAENFNYPYVSQSVTEFWRRWHMTLSNWFRDYVYIPLGGNRHGKLRTYLNLSIVFLLCGLWHGASWTFLLWGGYHGLLLVVERCGLSQFLGRLGAVTRHLYALLAVMVGWVLFRAESLPQAFAFLKAMAGLGTAVSPAYPIKLYADLVLLPILIAGILVCIPWQKPRWDMLREPGREWGQRIRIALVGAARMATVAVVLAICCVRLAGGSHNPFIYYRF